MFDKIASFYVSSTWYLEKFYIQYIDNEPYKLKAPFDMSFIRQYGEVFKIYDDQDSGNICFGVNNSENRYFIKFAGAPTEQYPEMPEDSITMRAISDNNPYTSLLKNGTKQKRRLWLC